MHSGRNGEDAGTSPGTLGCMTSFVCRVNIGGTVKSVTITVKSAKGEYEVGRPTS
ncbi:hypothetical protein SAMN05216188_101245 [Lentzea xinjiangensis]|uniref:DUF4333 domain-containing protein n=1 Tax=Lentzea xinjiangensis TaxID=402600 RepID=A0A1H9A2X3_9PSEU|nr:hypothetical protein SAMN05216188_101245 [Lentzea xinjiangensis]